MGRIRQRSSWGIRAWLAVVVVVGLVPIAVPAAELAEKPPAPYGVQSLAVYEDRIGEPGLLIEDADLQMWVPQTYEEHSQVIFSYLQSGYDVLSEIFGGHDMPVKFSVEHYPPGSPYAWGGTDAQGTIRYGYANLEDDTSEWNLYGVPHVVGYYEEMGHCFIYDLGLRGEHSVGFYETLGMMTGMETTLRAAWNPYSETTIEQWYETFAASTAYYLDHDTCEPEITEEICLTRILAHVFQTEVVDVHGWQALTDAFGTIRNGYPMRAYARDHTWGGFLEYLGAVVVQDLHPIFASYGLPELQWTEGAGYELDGVKPEDSSSLYQFRIKAFDREANQPVDVKLHLYGEGLWQIGAGDDSWAEFDALPFDDPEEVVFTIGEPDSEFTRGIGTDIGPQRSAIEIHFGADLSAGSVLVIRWTPGGSSAVEQFSVALDGTLVGLSQALSGETDPYAFVSESFDLPPTSGAEHVLRLEHLMGDGNYWDVLTLGGCSDEIPMSFVGGNAATGWVYQSEVQIGAPGGCWYAFSANDSVHEVFQAVGHPTVKRPLLPQRVYLPLMANGG